MNRAPFQLVDSRGAMSQLSTVSDHHQRKGAAYAGRQIGCQRQVRMLGKPCEWGRVLQSYSSVLGF